MLNLSKDLSVNELEQQLPEVPRLDPQAVEMWQGFFDGAPEQRAELVLEGRHWNASQILEGQLDDSLATAVDLWLGAAEDLLPEQRLRVELTRGEGTLQVEHQVAEPGKAVQQWHSPVPPEAPLSQLTTALQQWVDGQGDNNIRLVLRTFSR